METGIHSFRKLEQNPTSNCVKTFLATITTNTSENWNKTSMEIKVTVLETGPGICWKLEAGTNEKLASNAADWKVSVN